MSYGELYGLVERFSHTLYVEGLRAGDRIALLGDPDPQARCCVLCSSWDRRYTTRSFSYANSA